MQHIITQDFARNQDPPVSSASATFQNMVPPMSSSGRVKVPSRYSPENQVQAPHHQRPSSRVSPENAPDKPRARLISQLIGPEIIGAVLNFYKSAIILHTLLFPPCPGLVSLQSEEAGHWRTMNPSLLLRAIKAWTNRRLAALHPRGERLTTSR